MDSLGLQAHARTAKLELVGEQLSRLACPGTTGGALHRRQAAERTTNGGVHSKKLPAGEPGVTHAPVG
jgi:hypothetical protein